MQTLPSFMLQDATQSLIQNLLASEAFVHYQQAHNHLDADHEALTLLDQFAQAQARLRQKQANSGVTQSEIDFLREIQQKVKHNKIIMYYAQSQQDAADFLREINDEINQLLGMNFAVLAQKSTC